MINLTYDKLSYFAADRRVWLRAGEIHYFRTPRAEWRHRLEELKASGMNTVATYMPWFFHEPEPGVFDFETGQHALGEYLDLANELGLWVIARPGPYQYSELNYGGIPPWFFQLYPEAGLTQPDGTINNANASYLHPAFLERTRQWFDQIIPLVAQRQTTRGGAVAQVQICNEIMLVPLCTQGGYDYNIEMMGYGRESGRWPDFLKEKYGSLAALNAAAGKQFGTWAEVKPGYKPASGAFGDRRLVRDYQECYFTAMGEYVAMLGGWMRDRGVDVPLVHNMPGPVFVAGFEKMITRMGEGFICGSDNYFNLGMDWDQNHPTPKYAAKMKFTMAMLEHYGWPASVFELPGSSITDFPPVLTNDMDCCYRLNLAYGMKGFNIYIFAAGYNPDQVCGLISDRYEWETSALNADGQRTPTFAMVQKFNALLDRHAWLLESRMAGDCAIGIVREYGRSEFHSRDRSPGLTFTNYDAFHYMRDALIHTAQCASLSPVMADVSSDALLEDVTKPLMLGTSPCLAWDIQKRLVRFLEAGGRLLFGPMVPVMDDDFNPCTVLADYLGAGAAQPFRPPAQRIHAFGVEHVWMNAGLFTSSTPVGAQTVAHEVFSGTTLGWLKRLPGGGAAAWFGGAWRMGMREHTAMLCGAMTLLGLDEPLVECDNRSLWTTLRTDGKKSMLFVYNGFTQPLSANLRFRDPATEKWVECGKVEVPSASVLLWHNGQKVSC